MHGGRLPLPAVFIFNLYFSFSIKDCCDGLAVKAFTALSEALSSIPIRVTSKPGEFDVIAFLFCA